jgi:predicted RNase H-like nuclease
MFYAKNRDEAWGLRTSLKAKISKQGLGILPMIREVDSFLRKSANWKNKLLESHPECAFQALNDGEGLQYSKHSDEGLAERIGILKKYGIDAESVFDAYPMFDKIDILDSLCLALTVKLCMKCGYETIPSMPRKDKLGLKMQVIISKQNQREQINIL